MLINGTLRKVQAVDGVDNEIMADDELYTLAEDRYHSEDKMEGVRITPEILEKNGFEIFGKKKEYYLVPSDPSLALKKEGNGGANSYSFTIGHLGKIKEDFRWFVEIQNIHELQHALRLCGIEKEITL